jgi:putative membrane-bound dehydrogenase-like protein
MRLCAVGSIVFAVCAASIAPGQAQKDGIDKDYAGELPRIAPQEPNDALKTFKLAPGYKLELVASEPLIRSPVAVDFDEDGRMYVAEFPEYNQQGNPGFKQKGCIKLLEDTKGNGVYDKVTLFADNLDAPVALACWDGGVFVGSVPNILYLKDTDGDGKADVGRVVFSGFARDKAGEAMLNSFRWGLDNRIHVSTSAAGGNVNRAEVKDAHVFNVRGQGLLFDPRTSQVELVAGSAQHGMSMDDWGRKFTCDNSNPCHLLMYDGRYLLKNPYVQAPPPLLNIHAANRASYLHRISPNEPWRVLRTRLRLQGIVPGPTETGMPSGHFTGTTGVTVYRGDSFPPSERGTLFVGEVANNLVYHAKLERDGVALAARRVEKDREFLASTDTWFRPVQFANAPDGTLYVIDMYRELIETTESIPPLILKHLHPEAGIDRGRIYRIVPEDFKRPPLPRLGKMTTAELVPLLAHANGWHRDTAARLLYQRQDAGAAPLLQKLAKDSPAALGRLHALYALDGLHALQAKHVLAALADEDPRLREYALKLAEPFQSEVAVRARLHALTADPDPGVRYQLAFSLGQVEGESVTDSLYHLAARDGQDSWMRLAILTSAHGRRGKLLGRFAGDEKLRRSAAGKLLLNALALQIGAANQAHELADLLAVLDRLPAPESALSRELLSGAMGKLPAGARERIKGQSKAGALLKELVAEAIAVAKNEKNGEADHVAAVRTLGLAEFTVARPIFAESLKVRHPQAVQKAVLETLARFEEPAVADIVIDAWPGLSPQVRASAAETLFARPGWLNTFLDAVEKEKIKTSEIDPARIQLLQIAADPMIRRRSEKLFAGTQLSKRQDVVAEYQKALKLKGDARSGKEIFKKNCSACHRLEGVGETIGAELAAIKERGADFILLNILDPNREVLPKFITYYAVTDTGRTLTGMIAAETATSITLRRPDGASETLLRVNIQELRSTGMSFMPEGLEKQINQQEMADLLCYLMSVR